MSTRTYPRLPIEAFGHQLISSGDLDPVYIALAAMDMPRDQLARWLLAYWLCYHPGAASWLSERTSFWNSLGEAARNETSAPTGRDHRWPRAPERRHWRGEAAVKSVDHLRGRYATALEMVEHCADLHVLPSDGLPGNPCAEIMMQLPYSVVKRRVTSHYAFGDWIAYKVADMLERVWGTPVVFTEADAMYEEPRKAALMVFKEKGGFPANAIIRNEPQAIRDVVGYLSTRWPAMSAPGLGTRPIDLQEIETVLCKWKSHMNGHYPPHNDLIEIRGGCALWAGVSPTANAFLQAMPPVPQASPVAALSPVSVG